MTIYATAPWLATSRAVAALDTNGIDIPREASCIGAIYFLEISIVQELQDGALSTLSNDEIVNKVIYYATYDSLPE